MMNSSATTKSRNFSETNAMHISAPKNAISANVAHLPPRLFLLLRTAVTSLLLPRYYIIFAPPKRVTEKPEAIFRRTSFSFIYVKFRYLQ